MPEFENDKEFEAWLDERSPRFRAAIATRAALRVFPLFSPQYYPDLAILRGWCILIGGSSGFFPNSINREAVVSACRATDSDDPIAGAATAAASHAAAHAVERSVYAVASATASDTNTTAPRFAASAAYRDTDLDERRLYGAPLWPEGGMPEKLRDQLNEGRRRLAEAGPDFDFWRRWYSAFEAGDAMDWKLQERIALIPPEDWEKGASHIAGLIREIEEEFKGRADPQAIKAQRERLNANAALSSFIARNTADAIDRAIQRFFGEHKDQANGLPEPWAPLETMPTTLRALALEFAKLEEDIKAKDTLIAELLAENSALNKSLTAAKTNNLVIGGLVGAFAAGAAQQFGGLVTEGLINGMGYLLSELVPVEILSETADSAICLTTTPTDEAPLEAQTPTRPSFKS